MFIQTERTPNPNTLKFIPDVLITGGEPVNFTDKDNCSDSPLVEQLFNIDNIVGVFLGYDFITITKSEEANWDLLKPELLITLTDYISSKKPILKNYVKAENNSENDSDLVKQIKELIETRVRPAVANDGGDIIFVDFVDGIVKLELKGSCSGCPSSTVTLKDGIENMLKYYVPEIIAVEAI